MLDSISSIAVVSSSQWFCGVKPIQDPLRFAQKMPKDWSPDHIDEWKVSRSVGLASNECPCGILRSKCDYHKG